eukprot:COSAG05_NODE_518_length_9058_cov_13.477732_3_plen_131_part_00
MFWVPCVRLNCAAKAALEELASQKELAARLQARLETERDEALSALAREREANASAAAATDSLRAAVLEERSAVQMQLALEGSAAAARAEAFRLAAERREGVAAARRGAMAAGGQTEAGRSAALQVRTDGV